ncbi:hypothetical protein TI39_contig4100g00017 [Zymoseptoria brevis]|uniref:Uncharacterized protein n=1 Tax=Zymoseptoria brevis TaxID=1047168 RepID=A0A0F4GE02_9PEZI|nr:hypothetical protein TI39_contig4100g00017 [Zymoseptoria brevis]
MASVPNFSRRAPRAPRLDTATIKTSDSPSASTAPTSTFCIGSVWDANAWQYTSPIDPPARPDFIVIGEPLDSLLARRRAWNRETDYGRKCDPNGWQGSHFNQWLWERQRRINLHEKEDKHWPDVTLTTPNWKNGATFPPAPPISPLTNTEPLECVGEIEEVVWGTWHYHTSDSDSEFSCSNDSLAIFLGEPYQARDGQGSPAFSSGKEDEEDILGIFANLNYGAVEAGVKEKSTPNALTVPFTPALTPADLLFPMVWPSQLLLDAADACHINRGFEDEPDTPATVHTAATVSLHHVTVTPTVLDVAVAVRMVSTAAARPVTIAGRQSSAAGNQTSLDDLSDQ